MSTQGTLPWYRLRWKLLLGAALITGVPLLACELWCGFDASFLYILGATVILVGALFVYSVLNIFLPFPRGAGWLELGAIVVIYLTMLFLTLRTGPELRSRGRWLLNSSEYKAKVMTSAQGRPDELKHMDWEGWGFPGAGDTNTYLVFDPVDALAAAANGGHSNRYPGIPCEVVSVRRLESHWYVVLFYTDTDWDHCA